MRARTELVANFLTRIALFAALILTAGNAWADKVICKNGMQHDGRVGKIVGVAVAPAVGAQVGPDGAGGGAANLIVLLDDDLRRVFVSTYQVARHIPGTESQVFFNIPQRVAQSNQRVGSVGPLFNIDPFDDFGRRALKMNTARGAIDIVQGITKITPTYCKVESLLLGNSAIVWDMRVATTSIPRGTLAKIFDKYLDPKKAQDRLQVVKFYIQSDRYDDARAELEQAIKDFPGLADLKRELVEQAQLAARRTIKEIQLRSKVGQHEFAYKLLKTFPDKDVAGVILLEVADLIKGYDIERTKIATVLKNFDDLTAKVEGPRRAALVEFRKELEAELNLTTLERMTDFMRLYDDDKLSPEQKLSYCVSGWLLGSGAGIDNLAVSLSLVEVRNLTKQYLSEPSRANRKEILAKLLNLEGGQSPSHVSRIVAHMKPPVETPPPADAKIPGFFKLSTPGMAKEADVTYYVQLPPEYDPYRRYPTIVTLSGAGSTPETQIDWWAGSYSDALKQRVGQASRRGYIVIAPEWRRPGQTEYEYSPREAAAVLYSLRDASRRFSVDTDRVYLSGHSMGGDAVWDLGLAHPDLFAGTIPVVAKSDKYVSRYWENARLMPFYFVGGELDGDKLVKNAQDFDRYLRGTRFDCTVVEYQGRGHEHFADEIQHIFTWMDLHTRNFFPKEYTAYSMRPWDNYFWWVEVDEYPASSMVMPANWGQANGRPAEVTGQILENNSLRVKTSAKKVTMWLSPEMVDLTKFVSVSVNGKQKRVNPDPSVETLLEDVRTRGDRQHPFWMKVEM